MILLISLSEWNAIEVGLLTDETRVQKQINARNYELLRVIDDFIKSHGVTIDDIQGIIIHSGVGSFTSARIATVVANIIGLIRQIPVQTTEDFSLDAIQSIAQTFKTHRSFIPVLPTYTGEPAIGPRKK